MDVSDMVWFGDGSTVSIKGRDTMLFKCKNRQRPCLFRLLAASGHQKLMRIAKRSAFQPASIKFFGAKTIQNQYKHIIG
jgi:hypothetical protein